MGGFLTVAVQPLPAMYDSSCKGRWREVLQQECSLQALTGLPAVMRAESNPAAVRLTKQHERIQRHQVHPLHLLLLLLGESDFLEVQKRVRTTTSGLWEHLVWFWLSVNLETVLSRADIFWQNKEFEWNNWDKYLCFKSFGEKKSLLKIHDFF